MDLCSLEDEDEGDDTESVCIMGDEDEASTPVKAMVASDYHMLLLPPTMEEDF